VFNIKLKKPQKPSTTLPNTDVCLWLIRFFRWSKLLWDYHSHVSDMKSTKAS